MLDRPLALWSKPCSDWLAGRLIQLGLQADAITAAAFLLGISSAVLIANGAFLLASALLLISRVCDVLDGAVARLTQTSMRGGFLDIALDFIFYASIPLAFAWHDPAHHALAAATLLFTFMANGSSFLAYAAIAATSDKHHHQAPRQERSLQTKSIYFLGGLAEGFETLVCFSVMCWFPIHFAALAYGFAGLCALSAISRIWRGWRDFS